MWQEDTELRRSLVVVTPDFGVFRPVEAEQFIASCVHDMLSTGTTRYFRGTPPLSKWSEAGSVKLPTDHDFTTVTCLSRTGYSAIESSQALASRRERYGESSKISDGTTRTTVFERGVARLVAHEIDHLHGHLYTDHMRQKYPVPVEQYRGTGTTWKY
ncbi:peptide deformylase [Amycolatopsis sp. cmx-11-51]|uniref:peptide deformylase n=1 Tax=Amycolatopsis sp. cmx-11-51 TaxID=2785797 RepID=UPI0039E44B68